MAEQEELQGGTLNAPSYPTASQTDPKGLYFIVVSFFRWPCYQIQADTPVDVWSNHACQVALFFPGVRTVSSGGSVHLRSSPASGNAPLGKKGSREPTGCVISKATQEGLSRWSCCHWIGQGMHPTPSIRSESERELLDLHFHRRPLPEFQGTVGTCRTKKSKDKGKQPHPEENRQREITRSPS